jgi:alkylation response protein AidB-like acyl-CoA dehydrogenase
MRQAAAVDLELSETQQLFRSTMRAFVDREIRPVAREWEQSGRYPTEIVATMAEMGLFGLMIPTDYGGMGADLVSLAIAFEEISRAWMGVAGILGSHSLACRMMVNHGTDEQKQRYLPGLATGERRTCIALTEPDAGSDLQGIKTRAERDGDEYVLNGTKMWITNARFADPMPVLCKTDPHIEPRHRGMSVILVDAGTPGFEVLRDIPKLGYKGPESCEVVFTDCRVPVGNLLGTDEGQGLAQVLSALEVGRINVAARAVGVSQAAYDYALAYSKQREAFGQPNAAFQANQHQRADMPTNLHPARLLTWWAAARADAGRRADTETGMAKLFASELALEASLNSMRIHGGYGYSTEFEVERLYRDAPLMAIGEGTSEILRGVIARSLLAGFSAD